MPVEETENEIRVRVREPSLFVEERIRQMFPTEDEKASLEASGDWPYNKEGIRALGGPLKSNPKQWEVQAFRFSNKEEYGWTPAKCEKWVQDHGETPKSLLAYFVDQDMTGSVKAFLEHNLFAMTPAGTEKGLYELHIVPESIKADGNNLVIEGWASTEDIDRDHEKFDLESVDTTDFAKNPIVLFMHDFNKPVGKVLEIERRKVGEQVKLWVKAAIDATSTLGKEVARLIKNGVLRAFSVHVIGGRKVREQGTTILRGGKLLEISVVSIPSNPNALFQMSKSAAPYFDMVDVDAVKALVDMGFASTESEAIIFKAFEKSLIGHAPNMEEKDMPEGKDAAAPAKGGQEKQESPAAGVPEEILAELKNISAKLGSLETRVATLEGGGAAAASADKGKEAAADPAPAQTHPPTVKAGEKKSVVAGGQPAKLVGLDVKKMSKDQRAAIKGLAKARFEQRYPEE